MKVPGRAQSLRERQDSPPKKQAVRDAPRWAQRRDRRDRAATRPYLRFESFGEDWGAGPFGEPMSSRQFLARLTALRTFRQWPRVEGKTPLGEPIVVVGSDRVVLRRGGRRLWVVGVCTICELEVAKIDLDDHRRSCQRPDPASLAPPASSGPVPRRAGAFKSRLIASGLVVGALAAVGGALAAGAGRSERPQRAALQTATSQVTTVSPVGRTERPSAQVADGQQQDLVPSPSRRLSQAEQIAFQAQDFSAERSGLVSELTKADTSISVDRLDFDPTGPSILLQVTAPSFANRGSRDAAWDFTQVMIKLWEPKQMAFVPNAVPSFSISINTREIVCPPGVMMQLGGGRAGRDTWEKECK